MSNRKICLIGASSDLGLAIAQVASELAGIEVYGISQNKLVLNYKKTLTVHDYETSEGEINGFVMENGISDIIILNGFIGENNHPVEQIIKVNFSIPVNLIKYIDPDRKSGITYTVISSLAAAKPREKNYVYGLSKYLLEQSIRNQKSGKYIIIRAGFIRTKMTKDHKIPPFAKDPKEIAKSVLSTVLNNKKKLSIKYSSFEIRLLFYAFKLTPLSVLNAIEKRML